MTRRFNFYSRPVQFALDSMVFTLCVAASFFIRFEGLPEGIALRQFVFWLVLLPVIRLLAYYLRHTYRLVWRFISLTDALEIAKSIGLITVMLLALRLLLPAGGSWREIARLPIGIIALEGLLSLSCSLGIRVLRRIIYGNERRAANREAGQVVMKRVLLYGAGRAGQLLQRELENDSSINVLGFVDDDMQKAGRTICGTRVLGNGDSLPGLVARLHVDEVIISMATASRQTLLKILSKCREAQAPAKIVPSVQELLGGRARISQVRETRPEDLLGRERVELSTFQMTSLIYRGKRVLITGAGGSIGSELARQLVRLEPSRLAVLDKDENAIYELEQELRLHGSRVPAEPQVADVRHIGRLRAIFSEFRPQIVFHAAAHKHVPLMELHPCEAILNNVAGTKNVIQVSREFNVDRFVFISTDKAVNPANIMGATKRIGEMLVKSFVDQGMRSACVRFGNVLGSRGSVLPLFQRQIAEGGPVTVTHPEAVRFFMTISEAVHLILCAGTQANGGDIFVLDMGRPRNIMQLAHEMILLSGLQPGKDIRTTITGLRPGEKLVEELSTSTEILHRTTFEKLFLIEPSTFDHTTFLQKLTHLLRAAEANEVAQIFEIIRNMELGFQPQLAHKRAAAG